MAVPKRQHTKSRTGKRRHAAANQKSLPSLSKCANCGKLRSGHTACPHCGFYKGTQVN